MCYLLKRLIIDLKELYTNENERPRNKAVKI
jgi:hypothetical protein